MIPKRGYQGKYRFRLYDRETESYRDLTTDEVQVGFFRIEHGGLERVDAGVSDLRGSDGINADDGWGDVCLRRMQRHNPGD